MFLGEEEGMRWIFWITAKEFVVRKGDSIELCGLEDYNLILLDHRAEKYYGQN